MSGPPAGWAQI